MLFRSVGSVLGTLRKSPEIVTLAVLLGAFPSLGEAGYVLVWDQGTLIPSVAAGLIFCGG